MRQLRSLNCKFAVQQIAAARVRLRACWGRLDKTADNTVLYRLHAVVVQVRALVPKGQDRFDRPLLLLLCGTISGPYTVDDSVFSSGNGQTERFGKEESLSGRFRASAATGLRFD